METFSTNEVNSDQVGTWNVRGLNVPLKQSSSIEGQFKLPNLKTHKYLQDQKKCFSSWNLVHNKP